MIETFYDEIKNVVTVVYEGNVNAVEEKQLCLKLQDLLPKCRRGFRLLVDLSPVNRVEEEAIPVIKKIMDLLNLICPNVRGLFEVLALTFIRNPGEVRTAPLGARLKASPSSRYVQGRRDSFWRVTRLSGT